MKEIIQIGEVIITNDEFNRYRLNDLHKAAGSEARHKPGEWLKLESTKELIQEIQAESVGEISPTGSLEVLVTVQGGNLQGTFAIKKLVYAYATWISAR